MRTPALRVQLQLGWNIYLLFNSDSELYVENRSGGARKHCFVNIFPLGWDGAESRIQGQLISHPFPGGISAKAISITHSGMLHRPDISTFYFYEPWMFQILVPWKFIKTYSAFTFTGSSYADNHFYKYICFKFYTVRDPFFIKIHVKVFLYSNLTHRSYFFKWNPWPTKRKKNYRKKYEIIIELNLTITHMTSYAIWGDEITGVMTSIKKINKN